MQDASLAEASLRETVLNESFDIPWAVAISLNGQYWAAGSRRGEVRVWREEGRLLHLAWQAHTDTVRPCLQPGWAHAGYWELGWYYQAVGHRE